jgi:hypothetical protein
MEILLIIWLLFGVAGGIVLANKGRSGCGGFALGFLLGPIGLIIALVMQTDHREIDKRALENGDLRKCPSCAELIKVEARKCRFCGSEVPALGS